MRGGAFIDDPNISGCNYNLIKLVQNSIKSNGDYLKLGPYEGLFQIRALLGTISDSGLITDYFKLGPF